MQSSSFSRKEVWFNSAGTPCCGWLYVPEQDKPAPIIILAHGLACVRRMRLNAYAERFCQAGYACLVFDYRYFGDSEGEPRNLFDIDLQIGDWKAAISFARSLEGVDNSRIILWGTSLSGGHVLSVAAGDEKLAAVISQCPLTNGSVSARTMNLASMAKVAALVFRDTLSSILGLSATMINSTGHPSSAALVTTPDAVAGFANLTMDIGKYRDVITARSVPKLLFYKPGRFTARIRCPILFCICEQDGIVPAETTIRYARQSPFSLIQTYPIGHFDIYIGTWFDAAVKDQLTFLTTHVPVGAP
ncbi:MAG: alpha/beta hydrolase [Alcanivorax sp.]|jgi:pimeloyl-ACP methyl ester carboxylesterase|nr:MAG: alpha/beta hydrolase [Alcanivorax sp.]